jgi:hypothetical protein
VATDEEREFSGVAFRRGRAIRFALVIGLLGYLLGLMAASVVTGITEVYMACVVVLICFFAIGFVRSFRAGIRLTDDGVEVRTTYSTKQWPWDSIEHARAHDRVMRQSPYLAGLQKVTHHDERTKTYPILDLTNGLDARLYGLSIVANDLDASSWIGKAVIAINRTVALRRGEPDPSEVRPR